MFTKRTILLITALLGIVAIYGFLAAGKFTAFNFGRGQTPTLSDLGAQERTEFVAGSLEQFEFLSKQHSSTCNLQPEKVMSYSDEARIQGSCCSSMDFHRYQEQVEALEKFSNISQIPTDPYDISVALAKELFGYQKGITLTEAERSIYDDAMGLSEEGGPCCCKCWRWIAFEGLAKFLISRHNFGASQIAEVWDLIDGCGGPGHAEHT